MGIDPSAKGTSQEWKWLVNVMIIEEHCRNTDPFLYKIDVVAVCTETWKAV